jgi:hypothetical protein
MSFLFLPLFFPLHIYFFLPTVLLFIVFLLFSCFYGYAVSVHTYCNSLHKNRSLILLPSSVGLIFLAEAAGGPSSCPCFTAWVLYLFHLRYCEIRGARVWKSCCSQRRYSWRGFCCVHRNKAETSQLKHLRSEVLRLWPPEFEMRSRL